MYFESVFIKPINFYFNIYNINLSEKLFSLFLASNVGRPLKLHERRNTFNGCVHEA